MRASKSVKKCADCGEKISGDEIGVQVMVLAECPEYTGKNINDIKIKKKYWLCSICHFKETASPEERKEFELIEEYKLKMGI